MHLSVDSARQMPLVDRCLLTGHVFLELTELFQITPTVKTNVSWSILHVVDAISNALRLLWNCVVFGYLG